MLGWPEDHLMVGGFLGDFIKGPIPTDLNTPIAEGARLHRFIDAQSDKHSALAELKTELPANWYRFAGILSDLYCDHLIARDAQQWLQMPVEQFSEQALESLAKYQQQYPERAKLALARIRRGRWLQSYAQLDFTGACLERIGQRIRFDNPLADAARILQSHNDVLEHTSQRLCADMQRLVAEWRAERAVA